MKETDFIKQIATAQQGLAELSKLGKGPPAKKIQVRQIVRLLSSLLGELETIVKASKHVEGALYDSENRLNTLLETATDGIISIDGGSTIRYANPAAARMFGYELAEMLGKNLTLLMPERLKQIHLGSVKRYITTGQRHVDRGAVELTGLHKSGREFPIEVSFAEYICMGSYFFTGIIRDVTDRKQAEEALRVSEQRLHEAQSGLAHVSRVTTMGEVAASIAHEVNQPLAGITTNAEAGVRWLTGDSPNLAEAHEAIRRIIRDAKRARDVISRMRSLFQKAPRTKERLHINEAIEEVVTLTQSEVRKSKVTLRTELGAGLPNVMGDRVQLQQVLVNLILNAIEAMSTVENCQRDVVVRTERGEGDEVRVAVRDSGTGFDPRDVERIFDAFHTTKPGGLGMGLAISRSILEAHGGRLWATPNPDFGATFQFILPVQSPISRHF
jgi:PAS domain S-box-containing protein